jgi:hypothetical protein
MLKNTTGMKRDTSQAKFKAISSQVSPALLPDSLVVAVRALVDKSGMIRAHMEMNNRSEMVSA